MFIYFLHLPERLYYCIVAAGQLPVLTPPHSVAVSVSLWQQSSGQIILVESRALLLTDHCVSDIGACYS